MQKNKIYWVFLISMFLLLLLPILAQDGMFFDGVTYAAIAKNMANGLGSFCEPHYTQTLYPNFHEHPPLAFGLQALFFKLLGNSIYVERLYTLLTAITSAYGIVILWGLFNEPKQAWLPILLWITIPLVAWCYKNNLLENTLTVFTNFAVYFAIKALKYEQKKYLIFTSLLIVLAFLTKGPVGLFPLSVLPLYGIVLKETSYKKIVLYFLSTLLLSLFLFYVIITIYPCLLNNLKAYFNNQLIPALSNKREITTNNRLTILFKLFLELLLPWLVFLFLFLRNFFLKLVSTSLIRKELMLFLLIGLSASLPLMVSLKQRSFYLLPSTPFFVIAISMIILPYIKSMLEKESVILWIKRLSIILLVVTIFLSILNFGNFSREKDKLADVYLLLKYVPEGVIIYTENDICYDWSLVAYLARLGNISLTCNDAKQNKIYLLVQKEQKNKVDLSIYKEIPLELRKYTLFHKK